jgi:hypothetical protein
MLYLILFIVFFLIFYFYCSVFFNLSFFSIWAPWINILDETWILQLMMLIALYFFVNTFNSYTTLLYFFIQLFIVGIYLSFYQLELFTAFLWVVELTVVLVCLLLLFYLNVSSSRFSFFKSMPIFIFLFFIFIFNNYTSSSFNLLNHNFFFFYIWEDYYESLYLTSINDVNSLTISYYPINNIELLIIGFLLLIGSVVCVNINRYQRLNKNYKVNDTLSLSNIYNHLVNTVFMRKQNMTAQNMLKASLNIFRKSKKKKNVKIETE